MRNRKYYPFERNNYYFGKLLTAKDFEAEQKYFNDKRRLVNRLIGGSGIVSGLGVVMADDTSVILQAGCAFDASGREIVAPETKVVKLSTIEGFDELTTTCAYLGIAYDERPADEVYAAMQGESGDVRFNKTRESYKLTLLDEALVPKVSGVLDDFVTPLIVYSDSEVTVTQYTPKFAAKGSSVALRVEIKKIGSGIGEYSFGYTLETPGFVTQDGQSEIHVAMNGLTLTRGESAAAQFILTPEAHIWGGGDIPFTATDFAIHKNAESFSLNERLECTLKPLQQDIAVHYLSSFYRKTMDKELEDSYDEKLWIAKIDLFRQKASVIIDKVYAAPFAQYAYSARQLMAIRELEEYYPGAGAPARQAEGSAIPLPQVRNRAEGSEFARQTACGVFDLGLGLGYNTKETIFSEEIMHGLGKGAVYVEVGVEYISSDKERNVDSSEILLGDIRLFASEGSSREDERIYNVSTAIKILPERGTFIVGVLPKEASGLINLRIRWFAMRLNETNKQIRSAHDGDRCILLNPDTIVVPPKGTAHISPVFINMPTEACSFKLVDAEGGSVDQNGVYTAPAKEGVYEIKVSALSDPSIYTHAFVIVTQKKKDE